MTFEGLRMAGLHSIIGRVWCNPLFLKHFPEVLKHFESLPHERLAWFLFVAPKGAKLVRTREGGNNEALYNAGTLPEFIYKGVYKGATKDGTLVEFVVGRYTLPYTVENMVTIWRGVSVLFFKEMGVVDAVDVEGEEGHFWLSIRSVSWPKGKIGSCYLVDYAKSRVTGSNHNLGEIPIYPEGGVDPWSRSGTRRIFRVMP